MPKKFVGENSKAVAARARKAAVKEAENAKKAIDAEDKAWEDNNKKLMKKKQKQVRPESFPVNVGSMRASECLK